MKGTLATIALRLEATSKFYKHRPVPYAYKAKVEAELKRLQEEGTIEPVTFSEWAAPIVPLMKKNGTVRICGDYRLAVKQAAQRDSYSLPRIDDIFASLAEEQTFTKLDLSQAYQQVALEEQSKDYVVINTQLGLFKYKLGVSAAPSILQRIMDSLLQDISGTVVYLVDILITGRSRREHLQNLDKTLERLSKAGLRLRLEMCAFMQKEANYLGHRIDATGLYPDGKKVQAIKAETEPRNVTELRSYLGILNYYGRFVPDLATKLEPLYKLLRQGASWE